MDSFTCTAVGCGKIETRFGAHCSCFKYCKSHHLQNGNMCPVYFTKKCSRDGCTWPVCKNSKGIKMLHCGLTCFRLDLQKVKP